MFSIKLEFTIGLKVQLVSIGFKTILRKFQRI